MKLYPGRTQVSRGPPGKPKQPPPAPLPAPYFVQMGDGSLREFARLQLNFYGIKQACNRLEIKGFWVIGQIQSNLYINIWYSNKITVLRIILVIPLPGLE